MRVLYECQQYRSTETWWYLVGRGGKMRGKQNEQVRRGRPERDREEEEELHCTLPIVARSCHSFLALASPPSLPSPLLPRFIRPFASCAPAQHLRHGYFSLLAHPLHANPFSRYRGSFGHRHTKAHFLHFPNDRRPHIPRHIPRHAPV